MTIAQIEGGLASQMFGYAAARRLALKHGAKVLIDPRRFLTETKRRIELDSFDVDAILLSVEQAEQICGPGNSNLPIVGPGHLHFDQRILDLATAEVLMVGNYVSEDYFSDIEDVLRKDFRRVTEPGSYAVQVSDHLAELEAQGYQSVAVHIRRGDYVTEASTNAFHGTCTMDYYNNAFRLIERLVENPWFVFFSNDSAWVHDNFGGERRTITSPPDDTPAVEDMLLMAACRHQVIANSGYSWWSAWLSQKQDQVVIGPRPFIANRAYNTDDILRRNWISLASIPRP